MALQQAVTGGEPLLALERVCSLSKALCEIALQKGATYSSLMVSNGTLLTKDAAEKLADARIGNVQITIDGYGDAHDSRRKLKSGERSFDKIMKNIVHSCGIVKIAVRMGIDKENTEGIVLLLKELASTNLKERVGIYFAPIISDVTPCFNYAEKTMSREAYGAAYLRTIETARELGYELTQISPFPPPVPIGCGHQSLSLITIDPQGLVYGCLEQIGHTDRALCKIEDYDKLRSTAQLKWLDYNPLKYECEQCRILPLCLGGCTRRSFEDGTLLCSMEKYVIDDKINKYIERFLELQGGSKQVAVSSD